MGEGWVHRIEWLGLRRAGNGRRHLATLCQAPEKEGSRPVLLGGHSGGHASSEAAAHRGRPKRDRLLAQVVRGAFKYERDEAHRACCDAGPPQGALGGPRSDAAAHVEQRQQRARRLERPGLDLDRRREELEELEERGVDDRVSAARRRRRRRPLRQEIRQQLRGLRQDVECGCVRLERLRVPASDSVPPLRRRPSTHFLHPLRQNAPSSASSCNFARHKSGTVRTPCRARSRPSCFTPTASRAGSLCMSCPAHAPLSLTCCMRQHKRCKRRARARTC